MMTRHDASQNDDRNDRADGAEQGATVEARALHGDQARAEQHEQPDAVELPAGTRIASSDPAAANEGE